MIHWSVLPSLLALAAGSGGWKAEKPLWLAVTTPSLEEALEPLADRRRAEGLDVLVSTKPIGEALADAPRAPSYLLLVGDHEAKREAEPWFVPAQERQPYRWSFLQREAFASDAAWGDLDGDGAPDLPVGRIPARTPEEVAAVVSKIIAYEERPLSPEDLRVNFWGGSPDYGALFDTATTYLLLSSVREDTPPWMDLWVLAGDAGSPLCGWPGDQPARFTAQMKRGGLLNVLMGHANADLFHSMMYGSRSVDYTIDDARELLSEGSPAAPMLLFACDSGDFARATPCLAESFLFLPAGPVATIAASMNSHPLTNYFTSTSLLGVLHEGRARLGDLWFDAQERASRRKLHALSLIPNVLKDIEGKLEQEIDVPKLQRDQLLMYALLGDPATRLRFPAGTLEGRVERTTSGWRWTVERTKGAAFLQVAHRPAETVALDRLELVTSREEANDRFAAANAGLGFTPLFSAGDGVVLLPPVDGASWEGTIGGDGVLRIVIRGRGGLLVGVFPLR